MASQETRLKKCHISLMKHPDTALYSGVILMGTSAVEDGIPTAYTDGVNKKYGREFISKLTDAELKGLILHENLHVALKHIARFTKEFKEDPHTINMAADYVVNDVIMEIHRKDASFIKLPDGGLYDEKYHNWSVREVYDDIRKNGAPQNNHSGGGEGQGSMDQHDFESAKELTAEEVKELSDKVDQALRQGGILAGRLGAKIPRVITDLLEPKIDWRAVLKEFVTSASKGNDEYTWRKFNKRMLANDLYMPSMENESVGELIVAIDTSGSIGGTELSEFASELASICNAVSPEKVRVLWWDMEVHGEQVFQDNYANIAELLKPLGGGGTYVSCVAEYLNKNRVTAEACIILSDGYVENDIKWDISCPTLWVITQNNSFTPPTGKLVKLERD